MAGYPVEITRFWYGLPKDLERIDALFERSSDGRIIFFIGIFYLSEFRFLHSHFLLIKGQDQII